MASHLSSISGDSVWLINGGCTSHMAKNEATFHTLNKSIKIKVKLENGEIVQSEDKWSISFNTKVGIKYINDIFLVPYLHPNFLSVTQMLSSAYSLYFEEIIVIFMPHDVKLQGSKWCKIVF